MTQCFRVLFLCTGNASRSIFAEAIMNQLGQGRFHAFSAGSHPRGTVHPLALEVLQDHGHDTTPLRSKHWSEFVAPGVLPFDIVVTLCARVACAVSSPWPGHPVLAHWEFDAPVTMPDDERDQQMAFQHLYHVIAGRISDLLRPPLGA